MSSQSVTILIAFRVTNAVYRRFHELVVASGETKSTILRRALKKEIRRLEREQK